MIRRWMPRLAAIPVLAVCAIFALSGCGSDEPKAVVDRDLTLHITMSEYQFKPANIVITVRHYPQRIHVVARNVGKLTHNLVIESVGSKDDQGVSTGDTVFLRTDTAHPGATVAATAEILPGTYRITCTIGNHDNLGMYGKLSVLNRGAEKG